MDANKVLKRSQETVSNFGIFTLYYKEMELVIMTIRWVYGSL